jgi:fatty-acyl-CoA synthase
MNAYFQVDDRAEFLPWSVGDLLRHAVARVPDRPALICPAGADGVAERRWTYRELQADAEAAARALLTRFEPGDRVATWAGASAEFVILQLGAALAGIVLVTLNPANRAVELGYLLAQSEARGIVLDRVFRKMDNVAVLEGLRPQLTHLREVIYLDEWQKFVEVARAGGAAGADGAVDAGHADGAAARAPVALPAVAPDAPAMILFTSGTTGKPKGVVLRHDGIVNNARFSTARIELAPGAVWLNVLPMFHIGGSVTMTLGCFANLGTQVLLAEFSADAMLDGLQRYAVNVTMAVPTMMHAMFQSERFAATDFSALQVIVTGGTAIAPELVREVKQRFGVEVMVMFGQTEAGGCMCLTRRSDAVERITTSVGTPLPLSELKVVLTDGSGTAGVNQIGEICVRTRCAMMEYFRMPERTAETIDAAGWVHTGDLGVMDADGYLRVTGRLKDMIIRGGENIYPREIEDVLAEHSAVAQAAVYGVPDPKWGEQVAAAIILKSGSITDGEALTLYLKERIARHKVPKLWQFVTAFPINSSGKIQKFILRERHANPE